MRQLHLELDLDILVLPVSVPLLWNPTVVVQAFLHEKPFDENNMIASELMICYYDPLQRKCPLLLITSVRP
jgi:ABC-type transport system involved in cytochrome c biogenesis permease component